MTTSYRTRAGEQEVLVTPRAGVRPGSTPIVMCHGAGALAYHFAQPVLRWQFAMGQAFEAAGLSIAHPDLGGTVAPDIGTGTWGNDIVIDRIEAARLALVALGCRSDKVALIGTSMGGLSCWNYTRANPTKVSHITAMIPVCDIEDMRPSFWQIDLAWNVVYPALCPARANPLSDANAALIASAGADIAIYYSTADTIAKPGPVTALAAKLGVVPTVISTTIDHSDPLFEFMPTNTIIARLRAAGA